MLNFRPLQDPRLNHRTRRVDNHHFYFLEITIIGFERPYSNSCIFSKGCYVDSIQQLRPDDKRNMTESKLSVSPHFTISDVFTKPAPDTSWVTRQQHKPSRSRNPESPSPPVSDNGECSESSDIAEMQESSNGTYLGVAYCPVPYLLYDVDYIFDSVLFGGGLWFDRDQLGNGLLINRYVTDNWFLVVYRLV